MEKTYQLKGLDCAHCAAKIETVVGKLNGVESANVDLMHTKMNITCSEAAVASIDSQARKIIHDLEPDVEVIDLTEGNSEDGHDHHHDHSHVHGDEDNKKSLVRILLSSALLVAFFFIDLAAVPRLLAYLFVYVFIGGDVILRAAKNIVRGQVFDENFLMAVATIGAMLVGEYPEAVLVMLFYQVGELFQSYAVGQSRKSIASLLDIRPDSATLLINGVEKQVTPEAVAIGQEILVKPGEKVPLDGVIVNGSGMIDTSALTGESVPRSAVTGDEILSGFINQDGLLTIRVEKTAQDSTVSRILDLVENASSKKAPAENFITKFARVYTPVVVGLAVLLAVLPPLFFQQDWNEWIYRALTFLVISCPCALVVSVPLTFFGGIGGASKAGILVKGSNYLELLAHVDTVVFDKTGTLTKGVFEVQKLETKMDKNEFLKLTASVEQMSSHPIAKSILAANQAGLYSIIDLQELAGKGITAKVNQEIIAVGNRKLMTEVGAVVPLVDEIGTIIYVAKGEKFAGYLVIADEIKEDAQRTMRDLKAAGIHKTVMLTGDNRKIAEKVAEKIGLSEVHAELLPEDKVNELEKIMQNSTKTAFVGDGMNDAPVLARADLGIAMGGLGSDAAIEAADVVIMNDAPSLIAKAVEIARKTLKIVKQNIVFSIAVKVFVLMLGALGFASMGAAVFADVGVTLIAVLNAMRALKVN